MRTRVSFHHFGIACRSIREDREEQERFGFKPEGDLFEDPLQQIRGLFVTNGPVRIELLEPLTPESPLEAFLKRKTKIYHQCFLCADLGGVIAELEAAGGRIISTPKPAVAFGGRHAAFLVQPSELILELVQDA